MSTPRAVRIPRAPGAPASRVVRAPAPARASVAPRPELAVPNRAGTQRVVRLTLAYLVVLAALYATFALYDRSAPGGTTAGTQADLVEFGVVALVLAVVGALLTLTPAPRAIEPHEAGFVIIGRWGRRTEWKPLDQVSVRLVRRHPPGFLSDDAVDSVEVWGPRGRRRSYLIEAGLLPEASADRTSRSAGSLQ